MLALVSRFGDIASWGRPQKAVVVLVLEGDGWYSVVPFGWKSPTSYEP